MTFVQGKSTGVKDGSGTVAPIPLGHRGGCLFLSLLPRLLLGMGVESGQDWGLSWFVVRWQKQGGGSWVMRAGIRVEQPPPQGGGG